MDEQTKMSNAATDARQSVPTGTANGTPVPRQRPRKHMGVATSDPDYLPRTDIHGYAPAMDPATRARLREQRGTSPAHQPAQGAPLHYERYLTTPKKGHAIFTSRQERARKRAQLLLAILIVAAIVLALVWFFLLR